MVHLLKNVMWLYNTEFGADDQTRSMHISHPNPSPIFCLLVFFRDRVFVVQAGLKLYNKAGFEFLPLPSKLVRVQHHEWLHPSFYKSLLPHNLFLLSSLSLVVISPPNTVLCMHAHYKVHVGVSVLFMWV